MATRKFVVTGEQESAYRANRHEMERQWLAGALNPDEVIPALRAINDPGSKKIVIENIPKTDWLTVIIEHERQCHRNFFGREFDLAEFEKTLRKYGRKKIKVWQNLGLEPHFLPKVSMMSGDDHPGWKVKPEEWFYKKQLEGKLFLDNSGSLEKVLTIELTGITVLVDTRLKPVYKNGTQMWEGDNLFGLLIADLRKEQKIAKYEYGPQSSRFGVSANEWQEYVRPALAIRLGLEPKQLRLEYTIEGNVIPQLYPHMPRRDDGKTDTWGWYEEYFEGRGFRLGGGGSDDGGLALVRYGGAGYRWYYSSFRPLAVL